MEIDEVSCGVHSGSHWIETFSVGPVFSEVPEDVPLFVRIICRESRRVTVERSDY